MRKETIAVLHALAFGLLRLLDTELFVFVASVLFESQEATREMVVALFQQYVFDDGD